MSDLFNGQCFESYANTNTLDQAYLRTQNGRVVYVGRSWLVAAMRKARAASFEFEQGGGNLAAAEFINPSYQ